MSKKLLEEGFAIGRYATCILMRKFILVVRKRIKYKLTTKRKHSDSVAVNLPNQKFKLGVCGRVVDLKEFIYPLATGEDRLD